MVTLLSHIFGSRRPSAGRRRTVATARRLQAEWLERRLALAAIPTATVTGPATSSLIGEEIPFVVTFDNTAANPADIGYAPFVDIVMPTTGDAPPTPNDGIAFKPNSATYAGLPLATTVLTFDAAGQVTHPFAKNPDGTPVVVSGKPGDELVVVTLPFGSFAPDQPAAEISFKGIISADAQPNSSYPVTATGGFRYQTDTAGNPTVDVATVGTTTTDPVEPQLFRISKKSGATEAETVTGPNFKHTYTVVMAVAPGQTVTDLLLDDLVPDSVQFVSLDSISGNGSTTITPVATPSTAVPGGRLARQFDQVIGTGSDSDVQMVFTYYVAQQDATGTDVIPLGSGGTALITNAVSASATWTSTNPNFPGPQTITSDPTDPSTTATITARTTALQKSFRNLTNPGSAQAGDTIEYTLNFQVSDFFALEDLRIADVLSDGQEFDASFIPTIAFTQQTESLSGGFDAANYATTLEPDGTQTVAFDVAAELALLGLSTGMQVLGAAIPPGGTGSPTTLPDPTPAGPGTTGTIIFRARILNQYRETPQPNADVVQGDRMSDVANLASDVLDYPTLATVVGTAGDGSSRSFTLASGATTKAIYAINGSPASGTPTVKVGDEVTYRLTYTLPFSSIRDYTLTDFMPLPIFAAQDLAFAGGGPSATPPNSGQWSFGPTDTFSQAPIGGPNPGTATANAAANSISWNFGSFADAANRFGTTDILFTVTTTDRPFGDGLLLTNQAQQSQRNANGELITSDTALAQVQIAEPELGITKGVVSTTNPAGVFTPTPVAPAGVTFAQPGQAGAAFTGTVTSGGLATTPIDAALSNVLANDLVKFTIIVENTGRGPNGAFDVAFRDTFDATKFRIPAGSVGLNLQVTNGTGAALAFTGDLFGTGITLVDPSISEGSLPAGKTNAGVIVNSGVNIAVICYDLQLLPTVVPLDVIPNTATLTSYANVEGGPNFVPPSGLSDDTTVTVRSPQILKSLVGTSIVDAFNTATQGVIGELATFEITVDVPRGTTPSAVIVDSLPPGLAFVQMVGTPVVDPGVTFTGSATPTVTNGGRTLTFSLGDVTNSNISQDLQGITLRFEAVVLNVTSNVRNKTLQNSAALTWTGHTELPPAQSGSVTVIEPALRVQKTASRATAQAGDVVTYTIVVSHAANSQTTAYDVSLADILPGGVTYVSGSLAHTGGLAPTTLSAAGGGNSFTATYASLTPGQTSTLRFQARLDANVIAGQPITNTVTEQWTSLPGNPGQITPNSPFAYERTGSRSTTQGQRNNYESSSSAVVTVQQPTVAKSLVTTSIVNAANSATQAVIGETATYTVTMTIPQGRMPAAQLLDTMGPGMAFVRTVSAVNNDPAVLTVPGLGSPAVLTGNGTTATWNLGDIVNADNDPTTDETITFTIETVVLNVNTNTSGVQLVNSARANWNSGANTSAVATSGPVTVIEPKLRTTKTSAVGGFGGNVGDPVTYTIVVQHSGASNTDAFGVTLSDVIPSRIANPSLVSVVDTAGIVTAADFNLSGNTLTTVGDGFDFALAPPGRTITLTVSGTLAGPLAANEKITNTNRIGWSSLPGSPGQITPNNPNAFERTGSGSTSLGQLNNYVSSGSTTITANTADLAVVKTVADAAPNVGDTITFTVTLTNNGPNTAHDVEVTDQFPASGLQFVSASPSQGSFDQATGVWTVGTVLYGGINAKTLTITAVVLPPAVNTVPVAQTNVATVTNAAEPDPNLGNNTGTATVTPRYADLGVKKTTNRVQPNVGEFVTYTVSLFNLGTSAATNVEVTDTLPSNVTFVSATPSAGSFDEATGIWSIPTVPLTAGVATPLTLSLVVQANAPGLQFNVVTITSSDVWDPNNRNNTARTPTDPQEADVVVSKTVDDARPNVGDTVTFTVTLQNLGPSTAQNVAVAELLPAGLQFVSATPSAGSYDAGTGVWTLGAVTSGTTDTLQLAALVLAPSSGPVQPQQNVATATSTTTDPNPDNNTGTATVTPLQTDLAIIKNVDDPTPNVGDTIVFDMTVTNLGPDLATNVIVSDLLPAGLTFVSAVASQGSYDAGTGVWTIGGVATADFPTLRIRATVDAPAAGVPAPATNTATVSGDEYDPDPSNNTDSATATPQYADLAVDKQVSDAAPNVGDTITFTITLTNLGVDTATGVSVLDLLPSGLQFVSATANEGTYDQGSGVWTVGTVDTLFARTLQIDALVLPPTSGVPQPQTNTASVLTSDQFDPDPSNNTDSVTEAPRYADLAVDKMVSEPRPNVGDQVTFTVTVRNLGIDTAGGVAITDLLPAGLTFVSASPSAGTNYEPSTGIWQIGTLPAGDNRMLAIVVAVADPGSFTNVAAVSATDTFDPNPTNDRDTSTVNTRAADLAVTKTVSDPAPNVGDTISFTVTVSNLGPDTANNVEITDSFPIAGLALLSAVPSQGTVDVGTGVWTVGAVDVGSANAQTLVIAARVLAPAVNTVPPARTNVATVTKADEYDPQPGNNTGTATMTPRYADLGVKKVTTNVQPNVGDTLTYTVSLFNLGTAVATNVEVTDALPSNVDFLSATPAAGTRFQETATGGVWSVPSIAPGQTLVLTISVQATSSSVAFNTATITHSDVWDPNNRNNTARTPTDPQEADVVVSKTVDDARPNVGDTVTFTVTLQNLGPSTAQNVAVAELLPAGLQFVSATLSAGSYDAGTGVWTLGAVTSGTTDTLQLAALVLAPSSGPVQPQQNVATATSTTTDPNPDNNTGTATVTPLQTDLAVFKTVDQDEPTIGETVTFEIVVANFGPDTATSVIVNDVLPAGLQFVSASASQGVYDVGTGVWTVGTVTTADKPILFVAATVVRATGGTETNTAVVSGRQYDPDLSNNTASVAVNVQSNGVIVGTDIGCITGPYVRVIDPDTGADRIIPFFAYEPQFRGGARVYGADVTGDGIPEIITASGPGRPGEVRVFTETGVPLPAYSFFPFGRKYTGGIEIAAGSVTGAGTIQIVAAQNRGGLVRVFDVNPTSPTPVAGAPVRQLRPFGPSFRGGVSVATADIGTFAGRTLVSTSPDGINELVVGSGPGLRATVKVYNGVPNPPVAVNTFRAIGARYARGVAVARMPTTPGTADKILVSAGTQGGGLVETYSGLSQSREAAFRAFGGTRAAVFAAASSQTEIFTVEGLSGTTNGVRKNTSPSGAGGGMLAQSTSSYPPLRVSVLRR